VFLNWSAPPAIRFDPKTADPFATHGIPLPTYGNYGGPNYSAGTVGGTTPYVIDYSNPEQVPSDQLDELFYEHDLVYQQYQDGLVPATALPAADFDLTVGMDQLVLTDPETMLFSGFATIALVAGLAESGYLETLDFNQLALIGTATQDAVFNYEAALDAVPGEARSLHGALPVFEAHFFDFGF
jgi:hypothetical protein